MLSWAVMGAEPQRHSNFLVVRSGGHRCAIPVEAASLVSRAPVVYPLPGSAPRLLGLAQVAGEPVAVVDLHALLESDEVPGGAHSLTVIVRRPGGGSTLGLAIDEAFGVSAVEMQQERTANDPLWVAGRSLVAGREVVILDPSRLFGEPVVD